MGVHFYWRFLNCVFIMEVNIFADIRETHQNISEYRNSISAYHSQIVQKKRTDIKQIYMFWGNLQKLKEIGNK